MKTTSTIKKNQQGSAHIIIIVVLVIALLGTLGYVFWQNSNKAMQSKTSSSSNSSKQTNDTSDQSKGLQTYQAKTRNFSFQYPAGWTAEPIDESRVFDGVAPVGADVTNTDGTVSVKVRLMKTSVGGDGPGTEFRILRADKTSLPTAKNSYFVCYAQARDGDKINVGFGITDVPNYYQHIDQSQSVAIFWDMADSKESGSPAFWIGGNVKAPVTSWSQASTYCNSSDYAQVLKIMQSATLAN